MKCTFCKNKATLSADFIHFDNKRTEIRACDKHYELACMKQNIVSLISQEEEKSRRRLERLNNPYPVVKPNFYD